MGKYVFLMVTYVINTVGYAYKKYILVKNVKKLELTSYLFLYINNGRSFIGQVKQVNTENILIVSS